MTEQLTGFQNEAPLKKIWKRWKWIGLALYGIVLIFNRWLPGVVVAVGYLYGIIVIANLLFHLFRYLKNRLFWRVRNRLISAFVFVGVIPLVLLAGIVFLTVYVLLGQLAGRYLEDSLHEVQNELAAIHAELATRLTSADPAAAFAREAPVALGEHASRFPRISARLLERNAEGAMKVISAWDPHRIEREAALHPANLWLDGKTSYQGFVRDGKIVLLVQAQPLAKSERLYLETSAPLEESLEERIQRDKSIYFTLLENEESEGEIRSGGIRIKIGDENTGQNESNTVAFRALNARRKDDARRMVTWGILLRGREFATGKEKYVGAAPLFVPVETVFGKSIGSGDAQGKLFLQIIYVLSGLFVFAELVSLMIGFTISRRITRSVHDMYQGILALQKGDLQHKIPVRRRDQLGLLAYSFNQMGSSITRLLEEVSEKKRLEQELEIAREVQATLFPKQLPHPRGMAIFGGCEPARVVSGDYYDFILEDEARLDIVVADISGKGISAALLMANLQAAMRNQLLSIKHDSPENIAESLAAIMAHLNQQIYLNSPAEKYATLFLSRYDAEKRRLWYCNAGHPPPILLDEQGVQLLEPTGMVVGLLPDAKYEAKSVELRPGSLLAIFTDGVTETVNSCDEEYGEERLLEALKQARLHTPEAIYRSVIDGIRAWQGDLPQHDDITLIVAKASVERGLTTLTY
jgi:sigma-B regulation protein RsbU (phosphoserine phosphatase)